MKHRPEAGTAALCAAIHSALQLADADGNTLVSALLTEAYEAASCGDLLLIRREEGPRV